MGYQPRLYTTYKNEIIPQLRKEGNFANIMEVPKLEKICLNVGLGEAVRNPKILETAVDELTQIAGQKPVITKAKKSIAGFKLREGMPIGARVTLRRDTMYEFFDRLVSLTIPRFRDFRGLGDKGFDGRGNYTLGIVEQIVFPEIEYEKVETIRGLSVTLVTTAKNDQDGKMLLTMLGFPFRKQQG